MYDVVIAGYGPTGAVAANLLGAAGLKVLVVEPNPEIYDIPRAVHFDGEVMRIFQALGLADDVNAVSAPGKKIGFTNGRNWKLFEQDLSAVPRLNGWFNNQFFNQPGLERCLREGVARYPNVLVRLGWAVSKLQQNEGEVQAELATRSDIETGGQPEVVTARYLLACDGASSSIRKALQIAQVDLHCDEPWLVCDLMLDGDLEMDRGALQICDPARPTTLVPCEGNHIRWEFMLNPDDELANMEEEATVRALMAPHLWRLSRDLSASDGELVRAKVYTFHALIAETFQQDRVFLLGDAAHQTPPFLGQGMCAGIRDAYNLCWKLEGVIQGKHSARVLETFTSERRPHVHRVIRSAVGQGAIIQATNPLKAFFRDCVLLLGRTFPSLASNLKFGAGWKLGIGLFDSRAAPERGSPIGEPLPQGNVVRAGGGELWSDALLGDGYTLVGFDVDPNTLLVEAEHPDWLSTLHLGSGGDAQEMQGELMNWATEHEVAVALVRPDRQVYGVCSLGAELANDVQTMLGRLRQQLALAA